MQQQGVLGLYRGLGVTLLEIVPYAALQFGLYDAFNTALDTRRHKAQQQQKLAFGSQSNSNFDNSLVNHGGGAFQAFVCGFLSGTIAKLGTHPLDVAKKRFQVAGLARSTRYGERVATENVVTLARCLQVIYAKEGLAGFYKGALPSVLKAAPSAAVTFACYDLVIRALLTSAGKEPLASNGRKMHH